MLPGRTNKTNTKLHMKKLLLLFAAILMASAGLWAETVDYLYPVYNTDGVPTSGIKEWKTASVDATVVEDAATPVTWGTAGETTWYVVTGTDVTLSKGAICQGDVHLILADGAKLTATVYEGGYSDSYAGIQVSGEGNSFTIYGQAAQSGQLEAIGGEISAGIGGKPNADGSNITINGGTIMATGGNEGAGIGGGQYSDGSNITINGGTVTANGGEHAAGIGGGYEGNGSNITINGGTIMATGGFEGAGIGGGVSGSGSNITINGGLVTANGGKFAAGIGGGDSDEGFNITINGGTVTANGGDSGTGIGGGHEAAGSNITINGGFVTANSGNFEIGVGAGIGGGNDGYGSNITINGGTVIAASDGAASIGGGYEGNGSNIKVATNHIVKSGNNEIAANRTDEMDIASDLADKQSVIIVPVLSYIDENGEAQKVGAIEVGSSITPITWGEGWYVVNDANVQLAAGAICNGDVHLILADGAVLTATGEQNHAGIEVSGGNSLTIYGQTAQTGKLEANGGEFAAGIGGGDKANGSNITINGGTVTANGGEFAAGIGGGYSDEGFNITINGGNVTATGINGGAGIGGGTFGSGFNITINGGTVTANGEKDAACIGGGHNADGSNIRVATTLLVKADGNNPPTEEIEHDGGGDIAGKLNGKPHATITSILPFWNSANAAIDAAFKGITNENMKAIATTAKKNIEAATTTVAIGSIKEKALADLQYVLSFYNDGKADAFGTLSEKQNGPAVILTDKDGKEFIFYSPKSVEYIKVNEK